MWRDDAYLLDMLLAGRKAIKFVAGTTAESFRTDEILQNATMRQIQISGEAARMVQPSSSSRIQRFRGRKLWGCEIVSSMSILTSSPRESGKCSCITSRHC